MIEDVRAEREHGHDVGVGYVDEEHGAAAHLMLHHRGAFGEFSKCKDVDAGFRCSIVVDVSGAQGVVVGGADFFFVWHTAR